MLSVHRQCVTEAWRWCLSVTYIYNVCGRRGCQRWQPAGGDAKWFFFSYQTNLNGSSVSFSAGYRHGSQKYWIVTAFRINTTYWWCQLLGHRQEMFENRWQFNFCTGLNLSRCNVIQSHLHVISYSIFHILFDPLIFIDYFCKIKTII